MQFEWDENKRKINIAKHSIDFADANEFFRNNPVIFPDTRGDYGEKRYIAMGPLEGRVMVAVFAMRKNIVRIISMRKANKKERSRCEQIKDRLEKN